MEQSMQREVYYTSKKKKVADFFIGLVLLPIAGIAFGNMIAVIAPYFANFFLTVQMPSYNYYLGFTMYFPVIVAIAELVLVIRFARPHRRYILLGFITALVLPFLFFGACMLVLFNSF